MTHQRIFFALKGQHLNSLRNIKVTIRYNQKRKCSFCGLQGPQKVKAIASSSKGNWVINVADQRQNDSSTTGFEESNNNKSLILQEGVLCLCALKKASKYGFDEGFRNFKACVPSTYLKDKTFVNSLPHRSIHMKELPKRKFVVFHTDFNQLRRQRQQQQPALVKQGYFDPSKIFDTLHSNQGHRVFDLIDIKNNNNNSKIPEISKDEKYYLILRGVKVRYSIGLNKYNESLPELRWFISNNLCSVVYCSKLSLTNDSDSVCEGEIKFDLKFPLSLDHQQQQQSLENLISKEMPFLNVDLLTKVPYTSSYGNVEKYLNPAGSGYFALSSLLVMAEGGGGVKRHSASPIRTKLVLPYRQRSIKGVLSISSIDKVEYGGFSVEKSALQSISPPIHPKEKIHFESDRYRSLIKNDFLTWKPTFSCMKNVYSIDFKGPVGTLPAASFFYEGQYGKDAPKLKGYEKSSWYNLLRIARKRFSSTMDDETFVKSTGDRFVAQVLSTALTLYSNYCTYISDFAYVGPANYTESSFDPRNYQSEKCDIENFESPLKRQAGDCEDFGKYMLHMETILRIIYKSSLKGQRLDSIVDKVLERAARVLDKYYCFVSLSGVTNAAFEDISDDTQDLERLRTIEAHEFVLMIPKDYIAQVLPTGPLRDGLSLPPMSPIATNNNNDTIERRRSGGGGGEEDEDELPICVCEGTAILGTLPKHQFGARHKTIEELVPQLISPDSSMIKFHNIYESNTIRGFYKILSTMFTPDFALEGSPAIEFNWVRVKNDQFVSSSSSSSFKKDINHNNFQRRTTFGVPFTDIVNRSVDGIMLLPQRIVSPDTLEHIKTSLKELYPTTMILPPSRESFGFENTSKVIIDNLREIVNQQQQKDDSSGVFDNANDKTVCYFFIAYQDVPKEESLLKRIVTNLKSTHWIRIEEEPISMNYDCTSLFGGYSFKIVPKR